MWNSAIRWQIEPRQSDDFITYQVGYAIECDDKGRLIFKYDRALRSTELRSPEWLWEYLQEVICPTLVVHGQESDVLVAEIAQRMVDTLAFGSVVDIEHAGHSILGDNPRGFEVAVRRFLSSDSESARM